MASKQLDDIVQAIRADPYRSDKSIDELRAETARRIGRPLPPGVTHDVLDAGGVRAEWVNAPDADPQRVFMFIHGGGYYRGSPASSRGVAAQISIATGARVLSASYRLAPEHLFPAAVDDIETTYRWLLNQDDVDPAKLVVGGISAGGGLTLALMLRLKATGDAMPAAIVPLSAWTDMTQTAESYRSKADVDPTISKEYLDRMGAAYLGDADPRDPLASPLFGDLSGLPPMLIQVGTSETMLDDSRNLASRAAEAGVDVSFEAWDDMIHGWHVRAPGLPEANQALARIGEYVRQHADHP